VAATRTVPDYVRGLGLDAWVVGGAVRDELLGLEAKDADFVVPGVGYDELRAALEPYGRVEDLVGGPRRGSSSRRRAPSAAPAPAATTSRSSPTRRSRSRTTCAGATSR
jgi:hypothetical protein